MSGAEDLQLFEQLVNNANSLFLSDEDFVVINGVTKPTLKKIYIDFLASIGTFPSVAEGLTETNGTGTQNRFFTVPGTDGTYETRYRNDAGTPVEVGRVSSAVSVESLQKLINSFSGAGGNSALEVIGEDDFIIASMLNDGALEMMGGIIFNHEKGLGLSDTAGKSMAKFGVEESNINGLIVQPSTGPGLEIVDDNDFIHPGGDFSGVDNPSPGDSQEAVVALELNQQQRTGHKAVILYSQSLGRGAFANPVISTTQPYLNLMLAGGAKVRAGEVGYNPGAYVPLVEVASGDDGESPLSALCNGVVRRAVEDGETPEDWVLVGCNPGMGGQSVEALSPGGSPGLFYEKMVQTIKDQAALSKSLGKSYSVWAYVWMQGEANYSTTGSGATSTKSAYQYTQLQLELFDGLSREIAKIASQKFRPYLLTYQVAAHRKYSSDTMQIALAQWRASRMRPDVVLAAPVYIFPVVGDNLHLTNEGSWLQGEYLDRAMYETMLRRNGKWRPLEPVSVDWTNTYVDIKFHVPRGQLALDNTHVAAAPNFGFDIRESGAVVTSLISSVSVTGPDTVRLALSRPAAADALLSYARGRAGDPAASGPVIGARGNLRDTHGLYDTATSPLGNTFALHNWCVMFEFNRKTGF